MDELFREEAVQAQRPQTLGTICLATPLSFVWWAVLAAALAAATVLLLTFGNYTPRETVSGRLQATTGVFDVSANATGTVKRALVHKGEPVKAGQVLVEISDHLVGASPGNTQDSPALYARSRETNLRAPLAGTVTDLLVNSGQRVTAGQPVLSILPQGSKLQAQLLVPNNAIGFVAPGNRVVLRYRAFPYQRFGRQYGRVVRVSHTALTPAEAVSLLGQSQKATSFYEVSVALDKQSIDADGKAAPLMPNMALSADILLRPMSLWDWAFDSEPGSHRQRANAGGRSG